LFIFQGLEDSCPTKTIHFFLPFLLPSDDVSISQTYQSALIMNGLVYIFKFIAFVLLIRVCIAVKILKLLKSNSGSNV